MKNNVIASILLVLFIFSCEHKDKMPSFEREMNDSIVVNLKNTSVSENLDSTEFISIITHQKLQDVYDLLCWSLRDSIRYGQVETQLYDYFYKHDTVQIQALKKELDTLQVSYTKVDNIVVLERDSTLLKDSLGKVNYTVYYFDNKKKYLKTDNKSATYYLKSKPIELKKEFVFYLDNLSEKDTVSKGVTQ